MTDSPTDGEIGEEVSTVASWGDPGAVPSPDVLAQRPSPIRRATRGWSSRRGLLALGMAAGVVALVAVIAIRAANTDPEVVIGTGGVAEGPPSCADVARFADRMRNLGYTVDYNPSESPEDLAATAGAVVRGELTAVREVPGGSESNDPLAVFTLRITEVSVAPTTGSIADEIEISAEFNDAELDFAAIEQVFTPGTPALFFLFASSRPGGWGPLLEGFWVSCEGGPPVSASPARPSWAAGESLDDLARKVVGPSEAAIDGLSTIDATSLVAGSRPLTDAEYDRLDDDDGTGILDCEPEGSSQWDYGPIDESETRGQVPADGLAEGIRQILEDSTSDGGPQLPLAGWVELTDDNETIALFLAIDESGAWLAHANIGGSSEAGVWRPNRITYCTRLADPTTGPTDAVS